MQKYDKLVHPGNYLLELSKQNKSFVNRLKEHLNWNETKINKLFEGKIDFDQKLSKLIGSFFGVNHNLWIDLQKQYNNLILK